MVAGQQIVHRLGSRGCCRQRMPTSHILVRCAPCQIDAFTGARGRRYAFLTSSAGEQL